MGNANKAKALARTAMAKKNQPEGNVARGKLRRLLERDPSLGRLPDVMKFLEAETGIPRLEQLAKEAVRFAEEQSRHTIFDVDFTMADLAELQRRGGSTTGSWTAATFYEALELMSRELDYRLRQLMWERMIAAAGIPDDATWEDVLGKTTHTATSDSP